MSYPAFLADVRLACGFLSPDAWESGTVTAPEDHRRAAELADVWLSPAVVADYSPRDFGPVIGRYAEGVRAAVEAFRRAAASSSASRRPANPSPLTNPGSPP